jgi:hypothetical protein
MARSTLIGLAAGLASALLFASILSGSPFAVVLFYAAPLPVMIVALGWSHMAGLVAAITGSLVLGLGLVPLSGVVFAVAIGLPAWGLAYLAMLGRRDGPGDVAEWYPIGRIVAATALLATVLAIVGAFALGPSREQFTASVRSVVELVLRQQFAIASDQALVLPDIEDPEAFIGLIVMIVPSVIAIFWTLTTLFNLWLAGRIVKTSGRLARPWPDLPAMRLPRWTGPALGAAVLATLLPGMPGVAGELATAALLTAFLILGFAAIHDATRGSAARSFILWGLYVICIVMTWAVVLAVAGFGVADHFFDLRRRLAARRRPANDNS